MMQHAWDGYEKYAWGKNEVRPVSLRGHSASIFGSSSMGASIVDALDTLYIMGMSEEYQRARQWVEENLDVNKMVRRRHIGKNLAQTLSSWSLLQSGDISVFETNIRYVGGLLSIYALTGDDLFREKALHVAEKLTPAFKTPTGIPYALVNMRTGVSSDTCSQNFLKRKKQKVWCWNPFCFCSKPLFAFTSKSFQAKIWWESQCWKTTRKRVSFDLFL